MLDLWTIWAKRGGKQSSAIPYHPLLCHLIDVGEVARRLLEEVVSPAVLRWLADGLGVDEKTAVRWVVICAGLHDLGKSWRDFQRQIPGNSREAPHGTVSTAILRKMFTEPPFSLDVKVAKRLATIIGGHHGAIPRNGQINEVDKRIADIEWRTTWPVLVEQFLALYPIPEARPVALDNARAMWLAGFISASDWVGSNTAYFAYAAKDGVLPDDFDLAEYRARIAAPAAARALRELGWLAVPTTTVPRRFTELFPRIDTPNDLQEQAIRVAAEMERPGLVIVEAPMGEGKTEAALYLADQASVRWGMRGCYVALPTMATSNQMFGRVRDFLGHRYDHAFVQLQLLHGHAALSEDVDALRANFDAYLSFADRIEGIGGVDDDDEAKIASAVASSWFTGRKQGMLSPFGVGTIDQSLLAVLPIKHFFVRLFGLSNKSVILDEIHAYDAYMSALLERLLGWLAAMNCHVVLLSATLPSDKRARLLAAYQSRGGEPVTPIAAGTGSSYPCISWVAGTASGSVPVTTSDRGRKRLAIRWLDLDPAEPDRALVDELGSALANGGCAAVICNTVKRAQAVFTALRDSGHFTREEIDLFHARFLFKDRQTIERRCLARFDKPNPNGSNAKERPERFVLVATQVIEQSLDLDFDLMVSEVAPVDLLLQRAGRLHRHARASRPRGLATPELWIVAPPIGEEGPEFDRGSAFVYFPHILLRTWWELKDRDLIDVPGEVAALIEAVYGEREPAAEMPPELAARWRESVDKMHEDEENDARTAAQWRIRWPGTSGELGEIMPALLEDEDADVNPAVRAQTRLSEPSVSVVCHHGSLRQATFSGDPNTHDLARPDRELVRLCLENSVSISQRNIVNALLATEPPSAWKKNGFLRAMRPIELDEEGGYARDDWRLVIDPDLGVRVESTKGASSLWWIV